MRNRTAIITGGTRGIGKAIAIVLAKEGYNLVLNYLNNDINAKNTLDEIVKHNTNARIFRADVSQENDVQKLISFAQKEFNSLDVLINNAGVNIDKSIQDLSVLDWDTVINSNMRSVFLMSKHFANVVQEQNGQGNIVNIGSTTGIQGRKNGLNYCASKAGVIVMTKCMAYEFAPNIRVNCLIPGFTWTEETEHRFDLKHRLDEEVESRDIPLNRIGQTKDIAEAVIFLISDKAKYINGQKLIVDGGEFMF